MMNHHRVMVLGRNDGPNLCMVRALLSADYTVDLMHVFHTTRARATALQTLQPPIDRFCKGLHAFHTCITNRDDRVIAERLLRLGDPHKKMLLFPTDDLCAGIIDEYYDRLSDCYILPSVGGTGGKLLEWMEKDRQKAIAASYGIPVSPGIKIHTDLERYPVPDNCPLPCFLKPNVSRKAGKDGQTACYDMNELCAALRYFAGKGVAEVLAEEHIIIRKEYSLLGVATPDFVLTPGYFSASGSRKGVANGGTLLDPKTCGIPLERFEQMLKDARYTGLFDIDLIEDNNGNFYFIELNLRSGGSCHAVTRAGVNLPKLLADYLDRGKRPGFWVGACESDLSFINERELQNLYLEGRISLEEMERIAENADIRFLHDPGDPMPYKVFLKTLSLQKLLKSSE